VAVHQVRAGTAKEPKNLQPTRQAPRLLEVEELTVLTGWAQALAEALAYEPECVVSLLADAEAGAGWRSSFQLSGPSPALSEALAIMARAVIQVTAVGIAPTFEALHTSCRNPWSNENGLDGLVRRVLRAALEQLRTRQASELEHAKSPLDFVAE